MRRALLACCLTLTVAGCGADAEQSASPTPDPDQPVSSPADPAPPAGKPTLRSVCRRLGEHLVGGPVGDGMTSAELRGCVLRIAVLDGVRQALTADFDPSRINLRVEDGVVVHVEFMG
jgi:hypothetical protein